MQQPQDNKNLLLAIGLSVLVMVGWNYFYGVPGALRAGGADSVRGAGDQRDLSFESHRSLLS